MTSETAAARMRRLRVERGLTQQELADAVGASRQQVIRWEKGARPGPVYADMLAQALGVSVEQLVELQQATGGDVASLRLRLEGLEDVVRAQAQTIWALERAVELLQARAARLELERAAADPTPRQEANS